MFVCKYDTPEHAEVYQNCEVCKYFDHQPKLYAMSSVWDITIELETKNKEHVPYIRQNINHCK